MTTTTNTVLITGNTRPVEAMLRALGGTPTKGGWLVPASKAEAARRWVAATGPAKTGAPKGWTPCGYPGCAPGHCDECEGRGARRNRFRRG